MQNQLRLSARERQIMDAIYSLEVASVTQVLEALPDPPSRSAVRTFLPSPSLSPARECAG